MKINNKLFQRWIDAGLITQEQADAILHYESNSTSHRSSWALWGIVAIGVVAIVIGIISIIAANWDNIYSGAKLTSYLALHSLTGYWLFKFLPRPGLFREILIAFFCLLFFGGIGLIAQIYHIRSDGWSGILLWCGLSLPMVLHSHTRPMSYVWFSFLVASQTIFWFVKTGSIAVDTNKINFISVGVITVFAYYALGVFERKKLKLPGYLGEACRNIAFLVIFIGGTIYGNYLWYKGFSNNFRSNETEYQLIIFYVRTVPWLGAAIASLALLYKLPRYDKRLNRSLVASFVALATLTTLPAIFELDANNVIGTILTIGLWWILAMAAVFAGRKWLFDAITLLITMRILGIYFEVFGSMLQTGIGLIVSGLLILGLAWYWHKFRGRLALWVKKI